MNSKYNPILFILFLLCSYVHWSQENFVFSKNKLKDKVDFKLINNLILLPVKVNNVPLTFLLDTGASSTVIFSFEDTESIELLNYQVIKLRGLGKGEPVDALKSEGNTIQIGNAKSSNQTIYVVFDGALSFSSRLGYPVHGIIGAEFLKDFVVEVNNTREQMRFTLPEYYKKRNCRKCVELDLVLENRKPFLNASFSQDSTQMKLNLLIDSGSGDGLWLFENSDDRITIPPDAFEDYLGLGINGDIFGKRSKVDSFILNSYHLENVNTSYPDIGFLDIINENKTRHGSLGGEILKRFNWTIDYSNKSLILKSNKYFKDPFHYNMSGITLQQGGFTIVKERSGIQPDAYRLNQNEALNVFNLNLSSNIEFKLKQLFQVVAIRPNSPAAQAGVREGDEILEVNNKPAYQFELNDLNQMFYSNEGKKIKLKILRNGIEQQLKFELKDI